MNQKNHSSDLFTLPRICAFALLFLLAACEMDDMGGGGVNPNPAPFTGELITVQFTVGGAGFGDGGVVARSAEMSGADAPVGLRSVTNPLDMGVKVRIVVYENDTVYATHIDYEATVGGLLIPYPAGTHEMAVPPGTFRFVAYSFNETAAMPSFADTTAVITTAQEVLWGDSIETIGLASSAVHITMQHKMAKVVVNATVENSSALNSVDAEIYCYEPTLTVQSGVLNPNGSLTGRPVSWTVTDPLLSLQASDTLYLFTDEAPFTGIKVNQMSINSVTYTGPFYANYAKPLEAGKTYAIHLNFLPQPSGGSIPRITWEPPTPPVYPEGRYVITNDPRDGGLYFKFGSVVGIYSAEGKVQSLTPPIMVSDPLFDVGRDIAWSPVSGILNWMNIPCDSVTVNASFHTVANVKAGKGDPCRLVGLNLDDISSTPVGMLSPAAIDNGLWRMPTAQENRDFSGYQSDQSTADWWWEQGAPGNISFNVGGGEFPERGQGGLSKFLPAAGSRNFSSVVPTGAIQYQGNFGYYWSGDLHASNSGGIGWVFWSTNLQLNEAFNYHVGSSVRCVKQSLEFVIDVKDWIPGGSLGTGQVGL